MKFITHDIQLTRLDCKVEITTYDRGKDTVWHTLRFSSTDNYDYGALTLYLKHEQLMEIAKVIQQDHAKTVVAAAYMEEEILKEEKDGG